ncbi:hypothetical protein KDL01_17560 [Actinospica durhamensis]|uniref:DUF2207 domain-containing protein n=1 Tax=Actinospica durhamensis TaxID=1508375 RepID=A0A941EQ40_9ACTN|nr:hypothetical protein [Actinospica durhamensis]MBR7835086.1 hypothetical protein [Actinospica durhamensis]
MPASVFLAIGATAVWAAAVVAFRLRGRSRRDRRALGPTPPAVLLTLESDGRFEDPRLLNTVILELAERGVVELVPASSQNPAMIRPAAVPAERLLPEYLDVVLDLLLQRCGPSRAPIPLTAMRADEDRRALAWPRELDRAVRREAVARGLLQPSVRGLRRWSLLLAGLAPSALIAAALASYWSVKTFLPLIAFLLAAMLATAAASSVLRARVTPLGAAELRTAGRQPGHLVAASARFPSGQSASAQSPDPRAAPPSQLSPLPSHQIWSDHGGSWHPLNLDSREVYSETVSRSPFLGVMFLAALCAASSVKEAANLHRLSLPTTVVFLGLPAVVLIALAARALYRRRLPKYVVLQGKVAHLRAVQRADPRAVSRPANSPAWQYSCTLDVGRAPASVRLNLGQRRYETLQVGDLVEVAVRPRRGVISGLRNLGGDF